MHVRSVSTAKRLMAGLFITAMLVLGVASVASAQSTPSTPSTPSCPSGASGAGCSGTTVPVVTTAKPVTTAAAAGSTLPRTGGDLWIPLSAGGAAVAIALAARRVTRRSIV
jgi:hypothetical protein